MYTMQAMTYLLDREVACSQIHMLDLFRASMVSHMLDYAVQMVRY